MNRRFRLRKNSDFQRVRREGRSYAHPLVVLLVAPNELPQVRIGVAAGRRLGGAVQRNRAKRRLREVMRPLIPYLRPGYDLVLIARKPLLTAPFADLRAAVFHLLRRARLLADDAPASETETRASTSA